jgi:hypothetical protein
MSPAQNLEAVAILDSLSQGLRETWSGEVACSRLEFVRALVPALEMRRHDL